MGKKIKWGKIGAPKSAKRKAFMRKIRCSKCCTTRGGKKK